MHYIQNQHLTGIVSRHSHSFAHLLLTNFAAILCFCKNSGLKELVEVSESGVKGFASGEVLLIGAFLAQPAWAASLEAASFFVTGPSDICHPCPDGTEMSVFEIVQRVSNLMR